MQISRTGYFLLGFFFLGGLAFTILEFTVLPFPILLGPIWMLTAAGLGVYALRSAQRGKHEQWLYRSGSRGTGTLVSARTGMVVNEQPRMAFELDLDVPGHEPRRVTYKTLVSNFAAHRMQPGLVLPVYVNPQDPADILVVW